MNGNFDLSAIGSIFYQFFDYIFNTLLGIPVEEMVLRLKILSFILSAIFFAGIVYVVLRLLTFRTKFEIAKPGSSPAPSDKIAKAQWQNILKRFKAGNDSDAALVIIEADNLADDLMKRMGIAGDTMMERIMELNPAEVLSVGGLKDAHRVRNSIAHTPGFKITKADAKPLLDKYEKFFRELEVI